MHTGLKRVLFSQLHCFTACYLCCLDCWRSAAGGSGVSCPVPSQELESQGLMLSHIQEQHRRPRRYVSSPRVSCAILFVTLAARLMTAELPLLTGGTSQSVTLKITLTPREIYVCSTSHSLKKQQEPVWRYKHSCSHSRLVRNPVERSECPQSCFHSFAWRTNMEQWGGRMFSFHKFEKFEKKKKNPILREARRWEWGELQLWVQWGHCWCERIPRAISGKATCGNRLISLKRNKHSSPLMA